MSPAPETVRNNSSSSSVPIRTILSRAPQAPYESPSLPSVGPFSADRRVTSSIRRNLSSTTAGPRPAPFQRQIITLNEGNSDGDDAVGTTRAYLLSAIEWRRRRIEELRSGTNIATTIAEQWRRQQDALSSLEAGLRTVRSTPPHIENHSNGIVSSMEIVGPITPPPQRYSTNSMPRLFLGEESSDSESEEDEDDPDNKFPAPSVNEVRRTPPPTFLTPNTSPSTNITSSSPSSKQNDDDSSRNAYTLSCKFCANILTQRGMRARLVADATVHIWSTDKQPKSNIPSTKYNANGAQGKTCRRKICYINMSMSIDVNFPPFYLVGD